MATPVAAPTSLTSQVSSILNGTLPHVQSDRKTAAASNTALTAASNTALTAASNTASSAASNTASAAIAPHVETAMQAIYQKVTTISPIITSQHNELTVKCFSGVKFEAIPLPNHEYGFLLDGNLIAYPTGYQFAAKAESISVVQSDFDTAHLIPIMIIYENDIRYLYVKNNIVFESIPSTPDPKDSMQRFSIFINTFANENLIVQYAAINRFAMMVLALTKDNKWKAFRQRAEDDRAEQIEAQLAYTFWGGIEASPKTLTARSKDHFYVMQITFLSRKQTIFKINREFAKLLYMAPFH